MRAPPLRRLGAYMLDWFVFATYGTLLAIIAIGADLQAVWPDNPWLGQLIAFSLTVVPLSCYFALMESSRWQATLGKRLLGLKVASLAGERAARKQTFLRAFVKLAPWEIGHSAVYRFQDESTAWLGGLLATLSLAWSGWYVIALFRGAGRPLYDRVARTAVSVRTR